MDKVFRCFAVRGLITHLLIMVRTPSIYLLRATMYELDVHLCMNVWMNAAVVLLEKTLPFLISWQSGDISNFRDTIPYSGRHRKVISQCCQTWFEDLQVHSGSRRFPLRGVIRPTCASATFNGFLGPLEDSIIYGVASRLHALWVRK